MWNLLEYNDNYSLASGSVWNYYRDEAGDVDDNDLDGKSIKFKTKTTGKTTEQAPQLGNTGIADRSPQPPVLTLNLEMVLSLI